MKKIKIEIKSIYGNVLFSWESENNTQRETILEAIRQNADLRSANLSYADLRSADLRSADLRSANLSKVKHDEGTSFLLSQCPSEGAFIAWKKANGCIVKLMITETAKRSSATTLKCRCSEAKVLEIQDMVGNKLELSEIASDKDSTFVYKVGEIVRVDDFDDNRWNECSAGIHFFIARESAVQYNS